MFNSLVNQWLHATCILLLITAFNLQYIQVLQVCKIPGPTAYLKMLHEKLEKEEKNP